MPLTKGAAGEVTVPRADRSWHPHAKAWFRSLARSGQSQWYTQSDWAQAKVLAEVLSRALAAEKLQANLISTWLAGATELLTTEGARRRARVELERAGGEEEVESDVSELAEFRRRLQSG